MARLEPKPPADGRPTFAVADRSCPICGTRSDRVWCESNVDDQQLDGFAFASRKAPEYMHHRMVECDSCTLLYADPAPSADALAGLYHQAAFDSADEAEWAMRVYAKRLPAIAARLPSREGALDVGTGSGNFLKALLGSGFVNVRGIEPSRQPIEHAPPHVKPLIIHDVFRPQDFAPESLSLVSCFQTLEHLAEPASFSRDVYRLLRPGGAFYAVVHDRNALSARLLGTKSPIFDFEHLQLFSAASVERMLRSAGFGSVATEPLWNTYPLRYWAKLFPFPGALKRPIVAALSTASMRNRCLTIPAGNLSVVAYK